MTSRTRLLALIVPLTIALAPPAAQAKTYCVNYAPCPAGGIAEPSIDDALDGGGANANADADVIRVGPGTYAEPTLAASQEVDIVGAGIGQTTIVPAAGLSNPVRLARAGSSISDLSVKLTTDVVFGAISLEDGADATRVRIFSTSDAFTNITGFVGEDDGTTLDGVQTDLPPAATGNAVAFGEGGLVTDSTLVGGIGVSPGKAAPTTVRRSTLRASVGLRAFGSLATARNLLITPHPRDTTGAFLAGVQVTSGNNNEHASVNASHLTLIGPGATDGVGLLARANTSASTNGGSATLTATNTLVRGFEKSIARQGLPGKAANLSFSYSALDGATAESSGNGTLTQGSGNITGATDVKLVDPAGQDFRPRWDSPLIDAGDPAASGVDPEGDRLAKTRVRDSNGNGTVVRDIGAYEYQRVAPIAAFDLSSSQPLIDAPVAFANASTDPDGDPLSFEWSFGDGTAATTANPSHAYASPGSRQVALKATDASKLSASTSRSLEVAARGVAGTGQASGGATGGGGDRIKPVLGVVKLSRRAFAARASTRLAFTLSEPARVTLSLERRVRGRWTKVRGTQSFPGRRGGNVRTLRGRFAGRMLKRGTYRVSLVARDAAGNASTPRRAGFRVVRR